MFVAILECCGICLTSDRANKETFFRATTLLMSRESKMLCSTSSGNWNSGAEAFVTGEGCRRKLTSSMHLGSSPSQPANILTTFQ